MKYFDSYPMSTDIEDFLDPPVPGSKTIPEWYKKIKVYIEGHNQPGSHPEVKEESNLTFKGCSPFLDSMLAGYTYCLPADIELKSSSNGQLSMTTHVISDLILKPFEGPVHPTIQDNMPISEEFYPSLMMWQFEFLLKTPPGYSVMFTHPLNRYELPFQTYSGIVESDSFNQAVHFPFLVKKVKPNQTIMIKKGTPIVQFIPLKREVWSIRNNKFSEQIMRLVYKDNFKLKSIMGRSYKLQWWKKKEYR
jgi:hypothetical protein